jgi:indolepyruvate ferredoxin oxidoreductase
MLLIGHAWQQGLIPVSEKALSQAIMLNGVAVESNKQAFASGRVLAAERNGMYSTATDDVTDADLPDSQLLADVVDRRAEFLIAYQNAAYAAAYRRFIDACIEAEQHALGRNGDDVFAKTVARALFKLMAYKDEYEVARLLTRPEFMETIRYQFAGDISVHFHLASPLFARPREGRAVPRKLTFGSWLTHVLSVMARLRFLRGTPFDPFGYMRDRRTERQLIEHYKETIGQLLPSLSPRTIGLAIQIASLPEIIRGFGHVKHANVARARQEETRLLREYGQLLQLPLSPKDAV